MRLTLFNIKTLVAWTAGFTIAWGTPSYVALTIGVLADGYRFELSQAGLLASIELLAMAVAVVIVGRWTDKIPLPVLAIIGAVVALTGNALTSFAHQSVIVGVLRAVAGSGAGAVVAAANTSMSRSEHPERAYAQANIGYIVITAAFFSVMPLVYTRISYTAYFVAFAGLFAVAAGGLAFLPAAPSVSWMPGSQAPGRPGLRGMATAASAFVLWLSYSMLFSVSERVAVALGMTEENIGFVISVATLAGVPGGIIAWWVGEKAGRVPPLIITALGFALIFVLLTSTRSPAVYSWVMCVFGVLLGACLPYLMGFSASVDNSGAVSRLVGGVIALASALGPVFGARLAESTSFRVVGYVTAAGALFFCGMIVAVDSNAHPRAV